MDATLEKQRQPHPPKAESPAEPLIPRVFEMLDYCQASSPDEHSAVAVARNLIDSQGTTLYNNTASLYEQIRGEAMTGRFSMRSHPSFESFQRQRQDLRQLKLLAESMDQAETVGGGVADYLFKLFEQEEDTEYSTPLSEISDNTAEIIQPHRKNTPIKNKIVGGLRAGDELLRGTIRRVGETIGRQKEKVQRALGSRAVRAAGLSLALVGSTIAASTVMEASKGVGQRQAIEATASAPNPEAPSDIFEGIPTKIIECEPGWTASLVGETIGQLAERNGVTAEQVISLNKLDANPVLSEQATCYNVTVEQQGATEVTVPKPVETQQSINLQELVKQVEEANRVAAEEARKAAEEAAAEARRRALLAPHAEWLNDERLDPRIVEVHKQLALRGHSFLVTSTKRNGSEYASRHNTGAAIDSVNINGAYLSYSGYDEAVLRYLDDAVELLPHGEGCQIGVPNQRYVNYVQKKAPDCYVFVDIGTAPHIHLAVSYESH